MVRNTDQFAEPKKRQGGRKPGTKNKMTCARALRPRVEDVIQGAMDIPSDQGLTFTESLSKALHADPLTGLRALAKWLPPEVKTEAGSVMHLHLIAVQQLADRGRSGPKIDVEVTPNTT